MVKHPLITTAMSGRTASNWQDIRVTGVIILYFKEKHRHIQTSSDMNMALQLCPSNVIK